MSDTQIIRATAGSTNEDERVKLSFVTEWGDDLSYERQRQDLGTTNEYITRIQSKEQIEEAKRRIAANLLYSLRYQREYNHFLLNLISEDVFVEKTKELVPELNADISQEDICVLTIAITDLLRGQKLSKEEMAAFFNTDEEKVEQLALPLLHSLSQGEFEFQNLDSKLTDSAP